MADENIEFRIGHEEIVLRKRYELLSIINDLLIAIWFIIGSILFFRESTTVAGTWLFLLGSVQLLIRPVIRLVRSIHISRAGGITSESGQDF